MYDSFVYFSLGGVPRIKGVKSPFILKIRHAKNITEKKQ
jgi:hypothetical protein